MPDYKIKTLCKGKDAQKFNNHVIIRNNNLFFFISFLRMASFKIIVTFPFVRSMHLNKCQKFLRYLWQKFLSTWLAIIELVSTKYFGNHLILYHFILSLTTNIDGKSWIANIYHVEVQDLITGFVRSMYRKEWQMLVD